MDSTSGLPITQLTIYKNGVGFVERNGKISGNEVQLTFRADEINDALKSLFALDRAGGQVHGIHYETPGDTETKLADSPIRLSDDHAVLDLLRSLRGWRVKLIAGSGTTAQEYSGTVVGVDVAPERSPVGDTLIGLAQDGGGIVVLRLGDIRGVTLLEERAGQDLRYFLNSSRSEENHRTVTVQLSAGEHDLYVSYLSPAPTWRVSYRLVAERGSAGAQNGHAGQGGKLLLQGWGLFDNRFEEDLVEAHVTLVAGQPISFIYDLATSRIPERTVVEDEARVAAAPVEFAAATRKMMRSADTAVMAESAAPLGGAMRSFASAPMMAAPAPPMLNLDAVAQQQVSATGSDLGELFQYEVTTPVTVKRGESALVPILGSQLPYKRELLYNGQKLAAHPVAALRFTNDTALTLERGPVTVVEDGEYRGEAIVPFTKSGGEIFVAFAVELGVTVTENYDSKVDTTSLSISGAYLQVNVSTTNIVRYTVESTLKEERVVTIEQTIEQGADLVDTPAAVEVTAEFYRWNVTVPANASTEFVVKQRSYSYRYEALLDQSYDNLALYLRNNWLDQKTLARLKALLDEKSAIARNEQEMNKLAAERKEIYARQEQLRQNMAAVQNSGEEAKLRERLFSQLSSSEDRLNAIDARVAALKAENDQRKQRVNDEIAALGQEAKQGDGK